MGTIAEKLTYLNDTKQLLKENINNLGGNLTNEPFRQYASVLEGIYESLPKVSGIGSNLSLSPTMVGKIKLNEIQGNTLQDGTPTPSSPVPIESVTGLQNVGVCGKNMFKDGTTFIPQSVAWFDQNGNIVNSVSQIQTNNNYMDLEANKTYIFSIKEKTNVSQAQCVYIENNDLSLLSNIYLDQVSTTITPTKDMRVWIRIRNNENATNTLFVGQFEQDSSATPYEPYKGNTYEVNLGNIELNKIGDYEDSIKKSTGKNLLNIQGIVKGRLDNGVIGYESDTSELVLNDNSFSFTTTKNYRGVTSDYIAISENKYYYITNSEVSTSSYNIQVACYDKNKNYISNANLIRENDNSFYFLSTQNVRYVRIYFYVNSAGTITITNPQLEQNNQALPYEPYGKVWYIKKNIGKVVLNGSENGWATRSGGTSYAYSLQNVFSGNATEGLCNYWSFIKGGSSSSQTNECIASANTNTSLNLFTNNSSLNTVDNLKTWLSSHNTTVLYQLSTPIYEVITNTELIEDLETLYNAKSKNGTTNINVTSEDLSMILNVSVLKGE